MPSGTPLYLYIGELPFQTELRKGTHLLELLVQVNSLDELPWHWWSPATCISPNTSFRCLSWAPSRPHFRPGEISFSLKYFKQNVLDSTNWCFSCSSVLSENFQAALGLTTEFPKPNFSQVVTNWMFLIFWLTDWCPCGLFCRSVEIHCAEVLQFQCNWN